MNMLIKSTPATVPIHILSGFLGSGKTTLLQHVLAHYATLGVRAAVVMNEIGDVNLDGEVLAGYQVPMAELLSGCICCTIRDDLSMQIHELVTQVQPDVILIESTGIAQPLEIIDAVTEASLAVPVELRSIVVVTDGAFVLDQMNHHPAGKTFRLLRDQVRTASHLLLNKVDQLTADQADRVEAQLREWNAHAPIYRTTRSRVEPEWIFSRVAHVPSHEPHTRLDHDHGRDQHTHHPHQTHLAPHSQHHHTHAHVSSFTYYFSAPVDSQSFESLLRSLPGNVYRAKGIVSFTDTASRFLFQFAYREVEFTRIDPQGEVHDVAVFIGEQFNWLEIEAKLEQLERD
jgi:G3E family GTPase